MAAHPDTLRIVQTVHDTAYVVVRDTIVRVAGPFHEPMKSSGFFGEMSPFAVIVATIALVNAGYTAYISFVERARIRLNLGDHVGIVLNPGDVGRKFHLRC